MGTWSILDYVLNVCSTVTDVLHISTYLLLVIIAVLVAAHSCGSNTYYNHIYNPLITFLLNHQCLTILNTSAHGSSIPTAFNLTVWSAASNSLPYIIKNINDFFNNF